MSRRRLSGLPLSSLAAETKSLMPVHPKHYAYANSGALIFVIGVGIAVIAVADFALLTKVLLAFSWFWVAGFISEKLLSGYVNRVVELLSRP